MGLTTTRRRPGLLLAGWVVAVAMAGVGLAAAALLLVGQAKALFTAGTVGPGDIERLSFGDLATRSVMYARDGSMLRLLHAEENRVTVPLDRIPPHVVQAVLAAEDERFFEHGALDLRAMARALVVDVKQGQVLEGGSTITQQLVKTELLTPRQDLSRKTQEAALAIRLEERMSKRQILERYLNAVYFGNGAYGLQAAAERYFATNVESLSRAQGILLAGLIRNPVGADPFDNPQAARVRRDAIIDRLVLLGQANSELAGALKSEPLPTRPPDAPAVGADYFLDEALEQLLADPRLGATEADRYQAVYKGGLSIHTTLDPVAQGSAEKAVADILPDSGGRFNAAVASVDPATGAVRALVGGADFDRSRFNLATDGAGRQAGSSFKPFTFVAALEAGYLPQDVVLGSEPCPISNPDGEPDPWLPGNVEGQFAGALTLSDATIQSVNCAYARLVKVVSPARVVDVSKRLGITNPLAPDLSITLGSQGVTPLQMATAYATLAADGMRHTPYMVERVSDASGRVLIEGRVPGTRAISSEHARMTTAVLADVVKRGTGRAASIRGWSVAGKTGSTDNNADAWFVGYTPTLATAVWMGSPVGRVPMINVGGVARVYGGTFPARIWSAYTAGALAGQPSQSFPSAPAASNRAARFVFPDNSTNPDDVATFGGYLVDGYYEIPSGRNNAGPVRDGDPNRDIGRIGDVQPFGIPPGMLPPGLVLRHPPVVEPDPGAGQDVQEDPPKQKRKKDRTDGDLG